MLAMAKRQQPASGLARLSNFARFGKASTTCFHFANYHVFSAATYRRSKGRPVCSFQQEDASQPAPSRLPGSLAGTEDFHLMFANSYLRLSPLIKLLWFILAASARPQYCLLWLGVNNLPRAQQGSQILPAIARRLQPAHHG